MVVVDGQLAGQCDAWIDRYHGRSELGLWIDSRCAGRGVGTAAAALVIAELFRDPGMYRIAAPIAVGNVATVAVARRMGFRYEGTLRGYMELGQGRCDHELWALTRADWTGLTAQ